jgi:L-ascorbate metabolism protein UlaG (beta-lactamase superfamily)
MIMLKITYLSHSCFILDDGRYRVIIDPYITGNPTAPCKAVDIEVNYIIVTHGHGDHLGDAFEMAKRNDAEIIAVDELANYAQSKGVRAHNMHIGGSWEFPFGRVKLTVAHHGSGGHDLRYLGNPCGVVVSMGGKNVYHCGDTGLFSDMKLIGERIHIDCMMVPIGDNFTMGIEDAVLAVEYVRPQLAVPMHYNTFPVIKTDPMKFKRKTEEIGRHARVMEYGETFEL